jgi:hypothetical protein
MSFYRAIDLDHFYLVYFGTEEREYNNNVNGNYCMQIYSNGRYKSALHRVHVNSTRPRISVASFHSLPAERVIGPAPELVDDGTWTPTSLPSSPTSHPRTARTRPSSSQGSCLLLLLHASS